MAKIMFKPTNDQQDAPKNPTPGRIGLLVGYVTLPGGAWDGSYKCVDLRDFEDGASRNNARIWITRTVFIPNGAPTFLLALARAEAQKEKLADQSRKIIPSKWNPALNPKTMNQRTKK